MALPQIPLPKGTFNLCSANDTSTSKFLKRRTPSLKPTIVESSETVEPSPIDQHFNHLFETERICRKDSLDSSGKSTAMPSRNPSTSSLSSFSSVSSISFAPPGEQLSPEENARQSREITSVGSTDTLSTSSSQQSTEENSRTSTTNTKISDVTCDSDELTSLASHTPNRELTPKIVSDLESDTPLAILRQKGKTKSTEDSKLNVSRCNGSKGKQQSKKRKKEIGDESDSSLASDYKPVSKTPRKKSKSNSSSSSSKRVNWTKPKSRSNSDTKRAFSKSSTPKSRTRSQSSTPIIIETSNSGSPSSPTELGLGLNPAVLSKNVQVVIPPFRTLPPTVPNNPQMQAIEGMTPSPGDLMVVRVRGTIWHRIFDYSEEGDAIVLALTCKTLYLTLARHPEWTNKNHQMLLYTTFSSRSPLVPFELQLYEWMLNAGYLFCSRHFRFKKQAKDGMWYENNGVDENGKAIDRCFLWAADPDVKKLIRKSLTW